MTVVDKNKFDISKQTVSLMPNLIHSLDAMSMTLLFDKFSKLYPYTVNFYSIHDCFATTSEKVKTLMHLLRGVYTILYIEDKYLRLFDRRIKETIKESCGNEIFTNKELTEIEYNNVKYELFSAD